MSYNVLSFTNIELSLYTLYDAQGLYLRNFVHNQPLYTGYGFDFMNRDFPEHQRTHSMVSRVTITPPDTIVEFFTGGGLQTHTMTVTQC